jgi:hypothetical protein
MVREQLRDGAYVPAGPGGVPAQVGLATYVFHINHADEDALDQSHNLTREAVTTGPKFVLQQGEQTPQTLRFTGTILQQSQLNAMQAYFDACATRTVYFRDVSGVEFEVIITRFAPQRHRTILNPREPTLLWYWSYSLEMEVIR